MAFAMLVQRELRIIPRGWQHPTNGVYLSGGVRYTALHPAGYLERMDPDEIEECGYTDADFMPDTTNLASEDTEIAAYETISEGTPISPPFPNTPEGRLALVGYCAEHCEIGGTLVDAETWGGILFAGALAMQDIHTLRVEVR